MDQTFGWRIVHKKGQAYIWLWAKGLEGHHEDSGLHDAHKFFPQHTARGERKKQRRSLTCPDHPSPRPGDFTGGMVPPACSSRRTPPTCRWEWLTSAHNCATWPSRHARPTAAGLPAAPAAGSDVVASWRRMRRTDRRPHRSGKRPWMTIVQ